MLKPRAHRYISAILAAFLVGALSLIGVTVSTLPAQADSHCGLKVGEDGKLKEGEDFGTGDCPGPGGDSGGGSDTGSGGGGTPSCDLSQAPEGSGDPIVGTFCKGTSVCRTFRVIEPDGSGYVDGTTPGYTGIEAPTPESILVWELCQSPDGIMNTNQFWRDPAAAAPAPPTPAELAQQAYEQLYAPTFSFRYTPSALTYVGTNTYFWVDIVAGTGDLDETAGPAGGNTVRAVAEPTSLEITTGDGKSITCPWTTKRSNDCLHKYTETSKNGDATKNGLPAYEASVHLVYKVTFYLNDDDNPFTPGGVETELVGAGLDQNVPVPVGEIQTLITR